VRVAREHFDVADAVVACASLEDAGVKHQRRERRVAAGAAAANHQAIRIRFPGRDEILRGRDHVAHVEHAPLLIESLAIASAES
jgi:hypothetical protein